MRIAAHVLDHRCRSALALVTAAAAAAEGQQLQHDVRRGRQRLGAATAGAVKVAFITKFPVAFFSAMDDAAKA